MFNKDDIKNTFETLEPSEKEITYSSFDIQLERINREKTDGSKYYGSDFWYDPIPIENL
jgi:hypothetical protein